VTRPAVTAAAMRQAQAEAGTVRRRVEQHPGTADPPGTLEPCNGTGVHGWLEPAVLLTTSARRAVWSCPDCGQRWRLGP
jgi:hypothetical protein